MIDPIPMADASFSSKEMSNYWKAPESSTVRLAGQFHSGGQLTMTLSGTWGGLKFSKVFTTTLPSRSGAGTSGASIWANQQTEAWGRDTRIDDLIAMQNIGRDYHIVNRQMSLLALEPGMDLWTEMPTKPGQPRNEGAVGAGAPVSMDAKFAMPGANLDSASLEAILNGTVSGIKSSLIPKLGNGEVAVSQTNGMVHFSWSPSNSGNLARFQILDISGRKVAELSAIRSGSRNGNLFRADWNGPSRTGTYILRAKSGVTTQTSKLVINSQR
jgi:hypothetical protein